MHQKNSLIKEISNCQIELIFLRFYEHFTISFISLKDQVISKKKLCVNFEHPKLDISGFFKSVANSRIEPT